MPNRNGSIVSTRPTHLRRITANSEKVIKNPFAKEKNLNLSKYTNWLDPMSKLYQFLYLLAPAYVKESNYEQASKY